MFESTEGFLENTFRKPPGKLHHLGEVPFDPGLICFVWFCFPFSFFSRESGQEDRLWTLGFVSLLLVHFFAVVRSRHFLTYPKNFQGN